MTFQTRKLVRTAAPFALLFVLGCTERDALIGTGEALTTTPCTECPESARPKCGAGEVAACFKHTSGTCGWAERCTAPAKPDAGTTPGPTCPSRSCPAIICAHGNKSDPSGCPTCECNPAPGGDPAPNPDAGPKCPSLSCPAVACLGGSVYDANGCPTCKCHPDPDPTCATVLCPMGQKCELQEVVCVRAPCPPQPVCVPANPNEPNPCAAALCPQGTVCTPRAVTCVRAPCPPVAECVPQVRCGGIAGLMCPGLGLCQDDPTDSCNPANGGADCGGLCICKQPAECPPDRVWNSNPKVCACVLVSTVEKCGNNLCGEGEICCNPSCGVCAPKGGACDAIKCGPWDSSSPWPRSSADGWAGAAGWGTIRRVPHGKVMALLVLAGLGCRSTESSPAPNTACQDAYQRVTTDRTGHELAVAYREHVPTKDEKVQAAALWALLIRSAHDGQVDNELFRRLASAGFLAQVPAEYPTAFRTCATTSTTQAVISDPFQCTDDCLVTMDDLNMLLLDPLVSALKALGGLSKIYGESLALTDALKAALADPALAGKSIQEVCAAAISEGDAGALLAGIMDGLGQSLAVTAAVAELAGAAELVPIIATTGSLIGLAVYTKKLLDLANRIEACRAFKQMSCPCTGPSCGCSDLGAPSRGVMCCSQGGPNAQGGWAVITANPTCCVLNRADYLNNGDVCYAFPSKAPTSCPGCKSDADCCDKGMNGDRCIGGRCCGPDQGTAGGPTVVDHSCCSGVRRMVNSPLRMCAPAP